MKSMTPEEVLEYLPEKYVCIAMYLYTKWSAFEGIPMSTGGVWHGYREYILPFNIKYDGDWKDSLTIRKVTFADLEIGEEFLHSGCDYSFIKINENKIAAQTQVMYLSGDKEVTRV